VKRLLLAGAVMLLALALPASAAAIVKTYNVHPDGAGITVQVEFTYHLYSVIPGVWQVDQYRIRTLGGSTQTFNFKRIDGTFGTKYICEDEAVTTNWHRHVGSAYFTAGDNMHQAQWADWPWQVFWIDL
jgi:opacity protein-like surface antigen